MSDLKRCVQCGILKEANAFRKYTYSRTNNTEGSYRICKACEAINTAYRRAKIYYNEHREHPYDVTSYFTKCVEVVKKTEQLYDMLESKGLRTPRVIEEAPEITDLDRLITFYSDPNTKVVPTETTTEIPDELNEWLTADVQTWKDNNISPEYLQETIYESLKAKYRPQLGVDPVKCIPIYDDTYKALLNNILRRFDDYEEEYMVDGNVEE